ncbi:MAG: BLUF domain-containing protein [Planctomycetota bacterium]
MTITQLSYCSQPASGITIAQVQNLARAASEKNAARGITGFLLFRQEFFAQVLEGDRKDVSETFLKLSSDTRHHSIQLLGQIDEPERSFGTWSMGYLAITAAHISILRRHGIKAELNQDDMSHSALVAAMEALAHRQQAPPALH